FARLVVPALFIASMVVGYGWGAETPSGLVVISRSGGLSALSGKMIRAATDFDGDGFSAYLGGGDCAPSDPFVNPGAREIVDNGIDENCRGGDLSTTDVQTRVAPSFVSDAGGLCKEGCRFVFLTVDSLRIDQVGAYGSDRGLTPSIDALAADGVVFEDAYCLGPGTILTLPQTFANVHDTQLVLDASKRRQLGPRPLSPDNKLFTQHLADAGYQTAAVVGHYYLQALRYG